MGKLSQEDILRLKGMYVLSDVVRESHSDLIDIGRGEWKGTCPFHEEKTASFRVNADRYHCFGCHAHGDIIQWVQETRGLTFQQAVGLLIKKELPVGGERYAPKWEPKNFSDYDAAAALRCMEMNREAQEYFINEQENEAAPTEVQEYVRSRVPDYYDYGIGYLSAEPNNLIPYLEAKGFSKEEMMSGGLILQDKYGQYYTRLRARITIPLCGLSENILGFAGRTILDISGDGRGLGSVPKYVNPPNTPSFSKRRFLYHPKSKSPPNGRTFLVEGYFDAIAVSRFFNAYACMGTALSKEQMDLLYHTIGRDRLFILLDGDDAGLEAAAKVALQLPRPSAQSAQYATIIVIGEGDPDDALRNCETLQDAIDVLGKLPRFSSRLLITKRIEIEGMMKPEYDRSLLDKLIAPYVQDNIKQGWPHYNVVDWVMAAYPEFAKEIKEATLKMVRDTEVLTSGKLGLKEENVKSFIKAWMKPSREVRKRHGKGK